VRHHLEGKKRVVELFGEEAGNVARQHIISDLKEEGLTENDPFPRDEKNREPRQSARVSASRMRGLQRDSG